MHLHGARRTSLALDAWSSWFACGLEAELEYNRIQPESTATLRTGVYIYIKFRTSTTSQARSFPNVSHCHGEEARNRKTAIRSSSSSSGPGVASISGMSDVAGSIVGAATESERCGGRDHGQTRGSLLLITLAFLALLLGILRRAAPNQRCSVQICTWIER